MSDDAVLVRLLRERAVDNGSLVYAHRVYAETAFLARRHGLAAPRAVLEIGPGVNLGALFCFAASGVEALAGVDVAPLPAPPGDFYECLRGFLLAAGGLTWWRPWADSAAGRASFPTLEGFPSSEELLRRIEHRSGVSSEALPFADGTFDLVYSVAALEHVPDPAGTLAEIARVLAPGGLAIHEIDLKHHGSDDPLKFLEWDEAEWGRRATQYGGDLSLGRILEGGFTGEVYCNRLRHSAWLDAFRHAGLSLEADEPLVLLDEALVKPERFAEPYRSAAVGGLRVLAFRVVARRA